MVKFLTQEWLDLQREAAGSLPANEGGAVRVQYKVTKAPGGDVSFFTVLDGGRIVEGAIGEDPKAELVVTVGYDVFAETSTGALDPNAAYMQGRLKAAGHTGTLLAVLRQARSPEYREMAAKVAEQTEY
jgi:putative sterol carrier protein